MYHSFPVPLCMEIESTWEKLAVEHKDWQRTVGFKFAEVDCVAQADLCEDNEVVSYPTMKLYVQSARFTAALVANISYFFIFVNEPYT